MQHIHLDGSHYRYIHEIVRALDDGAIVCYPTDTLYGLGCDLLNKGSVDKLYQLKGLSKKKPLSFLCSSLEQVSDYAQLSNEAFKVIKKLTPGPYTFILKATRLVPKIVLTKQRTVGIRVPDNPILLQLLEELGRPLATTSATLGEEDYVCIPEKIAKKYHTVDYLLDDGPVESEPSTIIDFTGDTPVLTRQGKGDVSELMLD